MKRLCIITLAIVCLETNKQAYAEIRNGYDIALKAAQQKMDNLNKIDKDALNKEQRIRLKKWLKAVRATTEKVQENHAKTQELLDKLRMIDPGLYHEINTIKDCEGNETDVYVKVVDDLGPVISGITNLSHSVDNPNVYTSEYGDYTVSVRITPVNPKKDLQILVHELGHVRYQVPHLAEYTAFYKKVYQDQYYEGIEMGHLPDDPSHQSVKETLKAFIESWREYNKEAKKVAINPGKYWYPSGKTDWVYLHSLLSFLGKTACLH